MCLHSFITWWNVTIKTTFACINDQSIYYHRLSNKCIYALIKKENIQIVSVATLHVRIRATGRSVHHVDPVFINFGSFLLCICFSVQLLPPCCGLLQVKFVRLSSRLHCIHVTRHSGCAATQPTGSFPSCLLTVAPCAPHFRAGLSLRGSKQRTLSWSPGVIIWEEFNCRH